MKIHHLQGGSRDGRDTHESRYYRLGFERAASTYPSYKIPKEICDPFARNCKWANHTNDIDKKTSAIHHMDALEYLKTFEDGVIDVLLFDPPFSQHQADTKYDGHVNIYTDGAYLSAVYFECSRVLKHGGRFLKLGYNSNRPSPTFVLKEMWVTRFGGNRNDVIMTLWVKDQTTLEC